MGVLEDISGLSNPFGVATQGKWNIQKGIYTNSKGEQMILFFEERQGENKQMLTALEGTTDSGGRRLAVYEYPYLDGQRVDDLGRRGETYNFNLKFHGSNYQILLQEFIKKIVNDTGTGTLTHPALSAIRGAIKVRLKDYELVHRHDEFNAVTIKAVFVEDSIGKVKTDLVQSVDSSLKSSLQTLTDSQAFISDQVDKIGAATLLPGAIIAGIKARLASITGGISRLIGQIGATFSPTSSTTALAAAANGASLTGLSSGTLDDGTTLPPVFQVGYNPATQAAINANSDTFINANQVTPQQVVFQANQQRQAISTAIKELEDMTGNLAYDAVLSYRGLAVSVQQVAESAIASSQSKVKQYIVPRAMSLRQIAKNNNLLPDRQNDIESLNPYLPSVNYIPQGSRVLVPVS